MKNTSKKNIISFIYKGGRKKRLIDKNIEFPSEFFYGYIELMEKGYNVKIFEENDLGFRLRNKYLDSGKISERLILNHIITVFNAFDIKPTLKILEFKFDERQWEVLKPFLVFLKHIENDQYVEIKMDQYVVEQLRKI